MEHIILVLRIVESRVKIRVASDGPQQEAVAEGRLQGSREVFICIDQVYSKENRGIGLVSRQVDILGDLPRQVFGLARSGTIMRIMLANLIFAGWCRVCGIK